MDQMEGWFNPEAREGARKASRSSAPRTHSFSVAKPTKASPPTGRARKGGYAELVNPIPKYVASRTLKEPLTWNSQLLGADPAADVAAPPKASSSPAI